MAESPSRHSPARDRAFTLAGLPLETALFFAAVIGICLAQVGLLWRQENSELLGTSLLLWLAIASLLWDKRHELSVDTRPLEGAIGAGLLALVLARSFSAEGFHAQISPLLAFAGLCLLTARVQHLGRYWKELLVLGLLALSPIYELALSALNLPKLTAATSAFALWYSGFEVIRDGLNIYLPGGRVEVYGACSGVGSIMQMTNVAVLFLLLFPTNRVQKGICLLAAIAIGFAVNAGRVGLLAVLVANSSTEAFDYWHGGDGSMVFFALSVVIFWGFVWLMVLREPSDDPPEFA